jgi:hypothetical protein
MATNKVAWVKNLNGSPGPLIMKGLFQAGATQAVKKGEILELDSGNWIPLNADQSMAGVIAVANEEIKSGDRAGYYEIIVPRPGDVFEFELATAAATAVGTALYYSTSQKLAASGSNILAYAVGQEHYPQKQGHLSDESSGDAGTTVRTTSNVLVSITKAASYYAALVV